MSRQCWSLTNLPLAARDWRQLSQLELRWQPVVANTAPSHLRPPTKGRRTAATLRNLSFWNQSLFSVAQHLLRRLPSPWHGDIGFLLGLAEAKSWHSETPLCLWCGPLGCEMFPLLFPATLNWIWVKQQIHGLWLGWEGNCLKPGIQTNKQDQNQQRKIKLLYVWKRQSWFSDKEPHLPQFLHPSFYETIFLITFLCLLFPSNPHFSPLGKPYQDMYVLPVSEHTKAAASFGFFEPPFQCLPEGNMKKGHLGKTSWGGKTRSKGWYNGLPFKLLLCGSLSLSRVVFLLLWWLLLFPKSDFKDKKILFSGKSKMVAFKVPRLPWIHEKVGSFVCYCINVWNGSINPSIWCLNRLL